MTDGIANVAGSATLDITPVNDAPQTTPVMLTPVAEDSGVRVITQAELLANATDIEGDVLEANGLTIANGNGGLVNNGDGTWNYTPANNDDTSASFDYTITDAANNIAGSATLDITPVNDTPSTSPLILAPAIEDNVRLITQAELLTNTTDIDSSLLTATNLQVSTGTLVDNGDGTWNLTPAANDDTSLSFTYIVTDGIEDVAGSAIMDITPVNDAPISVSTILTPIAEDSGARVITQAELLANATDIEGDALTAFGLNIANGNGTLLDNGDGTWNFTPAINDNSDVSFNYSVIDGTDNMAGTATLDITPVNDTPQTTPVVLTPIAEDSGIRLITQAELLANATDIENDALTANDLTIASGSGSLLDNGDGTWNFTPASNDDTDSTFTYTVTDGTNSIAASTTLDITPVNDAPFGTDGDIQTTEDTSYTLSRTDFGFFDNLDAGDNLSAVQIDVLPAFGQLLLNSTVLVAGDIVTTSQLDAGQLLYIPGADRFGTDDASFEFRVIDDNSNPGNAISLAPNTLSVSIDPVSDAPSGLDSTRIAVEDTNYVFAIEDFGFSDPSDGDALIAVLIDELPTGGTLTLDWIPVNAGDFITVNEINTGSLQYLAAPDANGTAYDELGFRVVDGGTDGAANTDTEVRKITLDVLAVNDAPDALNSTISTAEDTEFPFSRSNFGFSDIVDGHALSFLTITSLPDIGTLLHQGEAVNPGDTINGASLDAGDLVYLPPLNVSAPASDTSGSTQNSFSFSVTDNGGVDHGGENTSTEQFINIDLTPVNDAPVLLSNGAIVPEGGTVVIDNTLLSGTDPDDTDPQDLVLTVATVPAHGQLLLNGEIVTAGTSLTLETIEAGSLSYIHDSSETSADGFNVTLADGGEDGALPAEGRFDLEITEVIDPPVELSSDTLQLAFGEAFDSAQGTVLGSGFSSLNSGGLSNNTDWLVELEVPPSNGTVELQQDGTFTYVHNGSDILNDEFSYRVTNADGIFTIATVSVTIDQPIDQAIAPALEETPMSVNNIVTFEPTAEQVDAPTMEESTEEVIQASTEPMQGEQITTENILLLPENSASETPRTTISNQVETQVLPEVDTSQTSFSVRETIAVTQHRDAGQVTLQSELQVQSAENYDLTLDVYVPSLKANAASNPGFLKGLSLLENDFAELEDQNGASYKLAEDTILGASFSVSVGALAWALRGGAIFGSMMAFTPLWKSIEIGQVAVMVNSKKDNSDNHDEDDDSVESLFDKSE